MILASDSAEHWRRARVEVTNHPTWEGGMKRRTMLNILGSIPLIGLLARSARGDTGPSELEPLEKSRDEWRAILPPERYRILFDEATEPAFSSPLDQEKRAGTYVCAACRLPLFESRHKFDSGTGWPSFTQPIEGAIATKTDFKLIWPRTEYHCARCGGHQGHVFNDGPKPRGERWCNNGLALEFVPEGEPLPELRS